jgi:hypothetical protein
LAILLLVASNGWAQGYIPTPEDQLRSIPMAPTPFAGAELPESVDLSANMPPPGEQGNQSSCTAWATAYALKSFHEKNEMKWGFTDANGRPNLSHLFSPSFIYNQINNGRDGGAQFTDALNLLSQQGAATLADMPYNDRDYQTRPESTVMSRARPYRIDYWRRVNTADIKEVKAHLNANYPVMFGALIDTVFQFGPPSSGSVWSQQGGKPLNGHAMILVGYDDKKHAFKLLNSWGKKWGDRGYGWISYDLFPKVTREGYVAKDAYNGRPPSPDTPPDTDKPRPPRRTDDIPDGPKPNIRKRSVVQEMVLPVEFHILKVTPNVMDPSNRAGLMIEGIANIGPYVARQSQIIVHFYFDAGGGRKGIPVASRIPRYSTIDGHAASGTKQILLNLDKANRGKWRIWTPYNAFALRQGVNYLVAQPVLFLDGCGHSSGNICGFSTITR